MALASSLCTQSDTHTNHSLNKLIYLFQLFDKCIIPQTLGNHFRRIISFMMWKDYSECAEQSLYSETVQEVRHSQRLGKEGLIDRKGIFFVAAPLVGFCFSFPPLQEWPHGAPKLLTLWLSSALHTATGISESSLFYSTEQSVHWQTEGEEGRGSGLPARDSCEAPPEGGVWGGELSPASPRDSMKVSPASMSPQRGWCKQGTCRAARCSPSLWGGCPITLTPGRDKHPPALGQLRIQRGQRRITELGPWLRSWPVTDVAVMHVALLGLTFVPWQRRENNLAFLPLLFNVWHMLRG